MAKRKNCVNFILGQLMEDEQHQLIFLIEYGSRLEGHDVDLVAILKNAPPRREISLGKIDMIYYDHSQALEMAKHMDPLITDPVLTGDLVWGDPAQFQDLVRLTSTPNEIEQSVSYLLGKSFQEYLSAQNFFKQSLHVHAEKVLLWALINLSFSVAYFGFASFYHHNQIASPIPMETLEQEPEGVLLHEILQVLRTVKNTSQTPLTLGDVEPFFIRFEHQLLGNRIPSDH